MPHKSTLFGALYILSGIGIIVATALLLWWMGQSPICKCGFIKLWDGGIVSAENSQHFTDWYTASHFIHGILFYGFLAWLASSLSFGARLNIALLMEAAWEIFENSDFIINRYREATIALDYFGDSVLNSTSDLLFMVLGFFMAWRVPIWVSIFVVIALEVIVGYFIRDNLILNVIMLIFPIDVIKEWQLAR